jgi:hypothetical protein
MVWDGGRLPPIPSDTLPAVPSTNLFDFFRMKPLIIISSQSLACGCLLAEAVMRTNAEKEAPHLIIGKALPSPEKILMEFKLKYQEPIRLDPRLKENYYERANPNQPWYAKLQKKRRRR